MHTCALTTGGGVKCWGRNFEAQLGDGTQYIDRLIPVDVVGLTSGVSAIATGHEHTCALTAGGGAKCWGWNSFGQLGDGTTTQRLTPMDVVGFEGGSNACYVLSTAVSPGNGGSVGRTLASGSLCNNGVGYRVGSVVRLTANAAAGYRWSSWSGTYGSSSIVNTTMDGNKSVTANFASQAALPKPVVVLVHGYQGLDPSNSGYSCSGAAQYTGDLSTSTLDDVPEMFRLAGYTVYLAHYQSAGHLVGTTPSLLDNAACLRNEVMSVADLPGVGQVVLIGHSMGGAVSRDCVAVFPECRSRVAAVLTFGTPNAGLNPSATNIYVYSLILGSSICDQEPGLCDLARDNMTLLNGIIRNQRGKQYGFIGGDFFEHNYSLPDESRNDGAIGRYSAVGWNVQGGLSPAGWDSDAIPTRLWVKETHAKKVPGGPSMTGYSNGQPSSAFQCLRWLLNDPPNNTRPEVCRPADSTAGTAPTAISVDLSQKSPALSGQLAAGSTAQLTLTVDSPGATLFQATTFTPTFGFTLTRPDATAIDPAYAAANPGEVAYSAPLGVSELPPTTGYYFTQTMPGIWQVHLTSPNDTPYMVSAAMEPSRTLTIATDRTMLTTGATLHITATMQSPGGGLPGANMQALLRHPGVVTDSVLMADAGGGIYTGTYPAPNAPGNLNMTIVAEGSDNGTPYARQVDTLLTVQSAAAWLADQFVNIAVDADANGKYESLNVGVVVMTSAPGSYLIVGDLIGGGMSPVAHRAISVTTGVGLVTMTLPFDGDDIRRSGINGPYTLTNLSVIDLQKQGIPAVNSAQNVYATGSYNWADFAATCYVLTTRAQGSGAVNASPPPDCNGGLQYASGTVVTLTATTLFAFAGWTGDVTGATNPITTTLTVDRQVTAVFAAPRSVYLPLVER